MVEIVKHKDKLNQLMTELRSPHFKSTGIEFITEYIDVLVLLEIAIDWLRGENGI